LLGIMACKAKRSARPFTEGGRKMLIFKERSELAKKGSKPWNGRGAAQSVAAESAGYGYCTGWS
jgi:hypothetical protein